MPEKSPITSTDTWKIWVDTGGTFTDCIAINPDGKAKKLKVLSNSSLRGLITEQISPTKFKIQKDWEAPENFIKGFSIRLLDVIKSTAQIIHFDARASHITVNNALDFNKVNLPISFEALSPDESPILAAKLITQTAFEAPLPSLKMRLATTKGTNALLEKNGAKTLFITTKGFKDLLKIGNQKRPDLFALEINKPNPIYRDVLEINERLDADGNILHELDISGLKQKIKPYLNQSDTAIALCLMHSYKNSAHEQALKKWLTEQGAKNVSVSSRLSPFIKIIPRAETTLVNAYLEPILHKYLDAVKKELNNDTLHIMSSAGGLVTESAFNPKDGLLSGPAGGVVGASTIGRQQGHERIISFDMGGTSTDVARYDDGFDYAFSHAVGNAQLSAPALSIETVAAGGGSICSFDGQKLSVGPDSAGASPGPACYGAGGPLTITDVNLLLGRLDSKNFGIPISVTHSQERLDELLHQMGKNMEYVPQKETVLEGFLKIANERMADAIRKISTRKGYDPTDHALVAFGGAGAQHACAIANELNIKDILIPANAGLLSAYGLGHAVLKHFAEKQLLALLSEVHSELPRLIKQLSNNALNQLKQQEPNALLEIRETLVFMRLEGQESTIEVPYSKNLKQTFKEAYTRQYGHWISERALEIESIRVVASTQKPRYNFFSNKINTKAEPRSQKEVQFNEHTHTSLVYERQNLAAGQQILGPALILDPYSTIVVMPGWTATASEDLTLKLANEQDAKQSLKAGSNAEAISLELFTNRFTGIAEEMGEMLKRTALSVNVKERMDFSCALLNSDGELIVNAPHIPVHLGALGICVRKLAEHIKMKPGDVVLTNHPAFGGSHLPDITVVTPIFDDQENLLGYAANRAHHAEIGGTRPGSMPPAATTLAEEGVVIPPMHLIQDGKEQWKEIRKYLTKAKYPTRNIEENMADLQAAIAANHRGFTSLKQLANESGADTVRHYMDLIKSKAAKKIKAMLAQLPDTTHNCSEKLDDGSILKAKITKKGKHLFINFEGTSQTHPGNLNATPAIVNSVVMYVLRVLIDEPIPLNEGLLDPVDIKLPRCMLNPLFSKNLEECPAVVGGNTEISQRLTDLLLKPFEKIACSQGTMNNVLFGNDNFGYYETIGGGTGAGPDFHGADAVHHHMTNTAGTDPEILEHRYPVRLERYEIRKKSGGEGSFKGGNGIERELTFLKPVSLSVLTQHRKERPYGLQGGKPGKAGKQWVIRKEGAKETLNSVDGKELKAGDQFIIQTPGGGGFGGK